MYLARGTRSAKGLHATVPERRSHALLSNAPDGLATAGNAKVP